MKCFIVLGLLALAAVSTRAQFGTGDAGESAGRTGQLSNLLAGTAGNDGQMSNFMGSGSRMMGLSNLLSGAGGPMGGGMFGGMTGSTGQWDNMGPLMRMMSRRGMGLNNMGNMGRGWGNTGSSGLGNLLTYSMMARGGMDNMYPMLLCQRNPMFCLMGMS